jgi:3-mercaptopyruvate sulfurtransferase SseA
MMDKGFLRVRPLQGGIEAWIAAGYDAEPGEQDAAGRTANGSKERP